MTFIERYPWLSPFKFSNTSLRTVQNKYIKFGPQNPIPKHALRYVSITGDYDDVAIIKMDPTLQGRMLSIVLMLWSIPCPWLPFICLLIIVLENSILIINSPSDFYSVYNNYTKIFPYKNLFSEQIKLRKEKKLILLYELLNFPLIWLWIVY